MNLLQRPERTGFPTEYLIARLRGRSVNLVKDWNRFFDYAGVSEQSLPEPYREFFVRYSQEGIWKRMLREFQWAYFQMNRGLRNAFYHFFVYFEVKTVTLCLRYAEEKERQVLIEDLLEFSLLSEKIKNVLFSGEDISSILAELESKFFTSADTPAELTGGYLENGLKGVEERLSRYCFETAVSSKLVPVLKMFFMYLIDIKNIIAFCKHVRWSLATGPDFISGGSISTSNLKRIAQSGSLSEIRPLLYRITSAKVHDTNASVIETALLASLTRQIRDISREQADIGQILDYLWKMYIEALNFSVLFYARSLKNSDIQKELVII